MRTLFLSIVFVFASVASAATYYISATGSDAANGTSTGTPWLTFSNANRLTLSAGDSVLMKAGDSFDGPLVITNKGSAASLITVGSYGAGAMPVLSGDHPSIVWGAANGFAGYYTNPPLQSQVNIQIVYDGNGFKYGEMANRGATAYATWLATFTNGSWGQDNQTRIYFIKTVGGVAPVAPFHMFDFNTVRSTGGYVMVRDLELKNSGDAISMSGVGNVVSNNLVHNCFGSCVKVESAWLNEVVSNRLQFSGYTMIYLIQPGGSNWVHFNTLATNTTTICGNVFLNASELNGFGLLGGTNNLVERNSLRYMDDSFFDFFYEADSTIQFNDCFHGSVGSPGGTGLKFHHNLFNGDHYGGGVIGSHYWSSLNQIPSDTGPVQIFNNVFYKFSGDGLYVVGTNSTNVVIKNNIFMTDDTYAGGSMGVYENGVSSDYNLFYSTGIAPRWKWNGVFSTTLGAFVIASGLEAHSVYTNALFVSGAPVLVQDFRQQPTSAGVNSGVLISGIGLDWNGVFIPQGAGVDMGAFENLGASSTAYGPVSFRGGVSLR